MPKGQEDRRTHNMSNTPAFFFDTADTNAIKKIWDKLSKHVESKSCVGITTNPNALAKVNCHTIDHFVQLVRTMSQTMDEICGGGSLIYVQVPNSCMSIDRINAWAKFISGLDTGKSKIALKIPHFSYVLKQTRSLSELHLNVTGIADAGTIIKALSYDQISYASIIPGRMEEVGINANAQLKYLCDQNFKSHQKIITGSMRTIQGLKDAVYYQTVPTIGTRVWDLFDSQDSWSEFPTYWENLYESSSEPSADYCPETTEKNIDLSKQFFNQMDSLGATLHENFNKM